MASDRRKEDGGSLDPRFAAIHTDQRFRKFPKANKTVAIDERFQGIFNDPAFQVRTIVDKRGRQLQTSKRTEDMRRYYHLKDEDIQPLKEQNPTSTLATAKAMAKKKNGQGSQGTAGPIKGTRDQKGSGVKPGKQKGAGLQGRKGEKERMEEEEEEEEDEDGDDGFDSEEYDAPAKGTGKGKGKEKKMKGGHLLERKQKVPEEVPSDGGGDDEDDNDDEEETQPERKQKGKRDDEKSGADARSLMWARARGLAEVSSSSDDDDEYEGSLDEEEEGEEEEEEYDSADEPLSDEEGEQGVVLDPKEWGVGAMAANPEEEIPQSDETRRLAIVDLDWTHTRAVDILALLRSFCPPSGRVERVTVYPSDYGLERTKEEAVLGPQAIFAPRSRGNDDDGEEEEEESEDEGREVDKERLRMYEKSKLRYFYAIAECDSATTASHIYNECDGMEFEVTAVKLDLRFVPDEQSFEGRQVRDTATSVPIGYTAPDLVMNAALQHTEPKLTWDAEDEGRKKMLRQRMTEDELKDDDFAAYLGSDDSDSGEEEMRARYQALLLGINGGEGANGKEEGSSGGEEEEGQKDSKRNGGHTSGSRKKEDDGMEMEVTFKPGLEELGERLKAKHLESKESKGETVWAAYLKKKKEKRRLRKQQGRKGDGSSDSDDEDMAIGQDQKGSRQKKGGSRGNDADEGGDDPFFKHEEDPFADPFFQQEGDAPVSDDDVDELHKGGKSQDKKKTKSGKKDKKGAGLGDERSRAELEMLMMDDEALRAATRGAAGASTSRPTHEGAGVKGVGPEGHQRLTKKEKRVAAKAAKAAARAASDEEEAPAAASFRPNLEDPRFQDLLSNHDFALDPTDPRFQKAKNKGKLVAEVTKRLAHDLNGQRRQATDVSKSDLAQQGIQKSSEGGLSQLELKSMVEKLKRKGGSDVANGKQKSRRC